MFVRHSAVWPPSKQVSREDYICLSGYSSLTHTHTHSENILKFKLLNTLPTKNLNWNSVDNGYSNVCFYFSGKTKQKKKLKQSSMYLVTQLTRTVRSWRGWSEKRVTATVCCIFLFLHFFLFFLFFGTFYIKRDTKDSTVVRQGLSFFFFLNKESGWKTVRFDPVTLNKQCN